MRTRDWLKVLAIGLLAGGGGTVSGAPANASMANRDQHWVEMAPDGGSIVRVLTGTDICPVATVDGRRKPMVRRAAGAQLPARPNKAQVATGAAFSSLVCELPLPRRVRRATLAGETLPLPPRRIDRVVLIGDTGCRLKAADHAWQSCNDPAQWPLAAIAVGAARLRPDLVLHVGDYLYRENACPDVQPGCRGTMWGYGEAGWRADFLDPAAPLLAVAPWVMVRGNHEECARAGQGWWRLLDPHPLQAARDCNDAANDAAGNHAEPYAVELGGARLIVADLMEMASGDPADPAVAAIVRADFARIDALADRAGDSFVTAHYPLNAVLWDKSGGLTLGSKPVSSFNPPPLRHIRAMLAGHIHLFQYAAFTDRPIQVITGFSGTQEDPALGPADLAAIQGKPDGAAIKALTTVAGRFGYALMERRRRGWQLTAFAADGSIMGQFEL